MKAMDAQRAPAMRPYGATDYGGDVHLTLESDDGAPSNANRGHGVSTTMPRLGVTGLDRGMRARRRLDLGGEVDVRGGCDRGWHVACAAGVAFIAGIALALALVASSAGGGDQLRALVAAAPRQKIITRSLPGLSEARTAALAKPRTAADPVDIDDGRPTVTVGFESSGDFYWLPMVRLLEAALPGVRLRLADPTYDWSAVSLFLFPCLFLFPSLFLFPYVYGQFNGRRVFYFKQVNLDELASTPAKGADSTSELRVVATSDPKVEPDIVVEGPDIFQAGREEGSRCAWGNKPWVQTTAEPSMFFNAWEW